MSRESRVSGVKVNGLSVRVSAYVVCEGESREFESERCVRGKCCGRTLHEHDSTRRGKTQHDATRHGET